MKNLIVETSNVPDSQSFRALIIAMIRKRFAKRKEITRLKVVISSTNNLAVPFEANIDMELGQKDHIQTKAVSINYLSAFSQALARVERQLNKKRA